jgi:hypothetical protein
MPIPGLTRHGRGGRAVAITSEPPAYLLLDDEHVASGYEPGTVAGLSRVWGAATKHPSNPVLLPEAGTEAGFVNAHYDAEAGVVRYWYQAYLSSDLATRWVAYAEADPATPHVITKPALVADTGYGTNVVIQGGTYTRGGFVLPIREIRPYQHVPSLVYPYKYASIVGHKPTSAPAKTLLYLSDDGKTFEGPVQVLAVTSDTYVTLAPGTDGRAWYLYMRREDLPGEPEDPDGEGPLEGDPLAQWEQQRQVAYVTANAMYGQYRYDGEGNIATTLATTGYMEVPVGGPEGLLYPDQADDDDYDARRHYGFVPWKYRGTYMAALWIWQDQDPNERSQCELVWGYTPTTWRRKAAPRTMDFPTGTFGVDWDGGLVFACGRPFEISGVWYYPYNGWDAGHNTEVRDGKIGLATIRKEGWAAAVGDATAPVLRTAAAAWFGGDLEVNADASAGQIRVRVLDSGAAEVTGYGYADMTAAITTDATTHTVTWSGGSLGALADQTISLEFEITSASLYAWRATG